jgi:hypothetical protein
MRGKKNTSPKRKDKTQKMRNEGNRKCTKREKHLKQSWSTVGKKTDKEKGK